MSAGAGRGDPVCSQSAPSLLQGRVSAAPSLSLIGLWLFNIFFFFLALREIYIKWAGFISKFQEESGWWSGTGSSLLAWQGLRIMEGLENILKVNKQSCQVTVGCGFYCLLVVFFPGKVPIPQEPVRPDSVLIPFPTSAVISSWLSCKMHLWITLCLHRWGACCSLPSIQEEQWAVEHGKPRLLERANTNLQMPFFS